jgi:hypothetical protein
MARRSVSPVGLVLVLFAAASGCTSHVVGEVDGPIDYLVVGGLSGGGDGTSLHVELDGTVMRHTNEQGTQTGMIDLATLDDLRQKILDAQFATLEAQYHGNVVDGYVDSVSVHVDGNSYTVMADHEASVPDRLKTVIDTLKDIHQRPLGWH